MAKESIAAKSGAVAKPAAAGFALPDVFRAPVAPMTAKKWPPYITFAHPKRSDEWNKLVAKFKNVQEGDMYFIGDELIKLDSVKLGLIAFKQYWAIANAAGEVQKASFEEMPDWKEHVEAVVLVYLADTIIATNVQFRTTKCPIAKALSDALLEASLPTWAEKSEAHKLTMRIEQPFLRFYGEASLGAQRTSKSSGMPYKPGQCTIQPTTSVEWPLIDAFIKDESTSEKLARAGDTFQRRLKELEPKLVK